MKWLIFFYFFFFFIFSGLVFKVSEMETEFRDKIYPNIFINGVDFGEKEKTAVTEYFSQVNERLGKALVIVLDKGEPIATYSGKRLNINYDSGRIAEAAYSIGRSDNGLIQILKLLASFFSSDKVELKFKANYDSKVIEDFIEEVKNKYDKPAKNALFKFGQGKVISFKKEEEGLEVDRKLLTSRFNQAIREIDKGQEEVRIDLPIRIIQPEITLAKANNFGIEQMIAEGKSDYSGSAPERIHNLILAASKFDGILIPKDEVLSFNQTVGEISSQTGYKQAFIIKGGKTVLGDGGGICQVSTTLFRTALNAGLPIIERTAHSYRVAYYENDSKPGFDATVFAPYVDLKIKNDTPAYILIQTEVDQQNNLLYIRFYGKKDDRQVDISPVKIYDVAPPLPDIRQEDPTLKKGVVKQIDFPAWGAKAVFTYRVSRKDKVIEQKTFFSLYRPWQAIYLVGIGE